MAIILLHICYWINVTMNSLNFNSLTYLEEDKYEIRFFPGIEKAKPLHVHISCLTRNTGILCSLQLLLMPNIQNTPNNIYCIILKLYKISFTI